MKKRPISHRLRISIMANLNRIILVGKLTSDPELRYTVEGLPVAKFTLAVDRFRGPNNPKETDFINIVAWRKIAEVCGQQLKKERLVLIEGRIQIRTYQTDAGVKKWSTEVVARNMQMFGAPSQEAASVSGEKAGEKAASGPADGIPGSSDIPESAPAEEDSDLPF
ncbi:single-stranded DNA-binding protein [Candidatus Margulisiibacteriota bacterium]